MANICDFSDREMQAFLRGELDGDRQRALAEHLRVCPGCEIRMARIDGLSETVLDRLRQAAETGENAHTVVQAPAAPAGGRPQQVGEYELLGQLGQGGMGVVYKARHERLNRVVALKRVKAGGGASAELLDRFRREAEAMARLQHRNIVQIFEVGEHDGVPFLVMEFVDGVSLARRLGGTPLEARQAADLVRTLAEAVAHAHERGVLHRDLTPANILLHGPGSSPGGTTAPKIADFGLARLLFGDATLTQTGAVLGTPSYLAPEQADGQGKEAGPTADVYALGAILYECLTGRPPFKAATALETLKQVVHDDPVPPRQLQPRTPRDLETICLKCLEKSPSRRYGAAEALARDLGHFLAGESIDARRVGPAGRAWHWGRRRPLVAGLLLALAVVTAGAFGLVTWKWREAVLQRERAEAEEREATAQRARAEERLTQACDVVDSMLTRVGADTLASVPHAEEVRRQLLEKALSAFDGLRQQDSDDPHVRFRAAYACRRTAELLKQLSKPDEAVPVCRRAIDLLEPLVAGFPERADYQSELAMCHGTLANLLAATDHPDDADREYLAAQSATQALVDTHPTDGRYRHELAVTRTNRATLLRRLHRPDEAEREQRGAQEIEKQLAVEFPKDPRHRYTLASSHYALGNLFNVGKRPREAEPEYRQAIDLLEELIRENPDLPDYPHLLGQVRHNLAYLLPVAAREQEIRRARDLHEQLVEDHSSVPAYREQLAWHCDALGRLLKASNPAEAESCYRLGAKSRRRLCRDFPKNVEYQHSLGKTLGELGTLLHDRRADLKEARRLFEEAIPHHQLALKDRPENTAYRRSFCDSCWGLADTCGLLGDYEESARAAAELPRLYPDAWGEYFAANRLLVRCVQLAGRDPRLGAEQSRERVLGYARQARAWLLEALPREPDNWAVWYYLAMFETLLDNPEGCRRACRDMAKHFANPPDADTGHWLARTCAVVPDSGVDAAVLLPLAERALNTDPRSYFYLTWLGALQYRAGRYPQALERLEAAARVHAAGGTAFDLLLRAMTYHRMHEAEKASRSLAEARRWQERAEKKELNDPVFGKDLWDYQELELRLLRREAEKLLAER